MSVATSTAGTSLLLVRLGGEYFALPIGDVLEVLDTPTITSLPLLPAGVIGQCAIRERLITVLDGAALLGVPRGTGGGTLLVLEAEGTRFGMLVDDVEDLVRVDPERWRSVPQTGAATTGLAGVLDLDGRLAGVVEMAGIRAQVVAKLTAEMR